MVSDFINTRIQSLKIRSPSSIQDRVLREIQYADWPETSPEEIIFIRKISASAKVGDIGSLLTQQVRNYLGNLGDKSNCIRFANQSEMIAKLLVDLTKGMASGKWYWQQYSKYFNWPISKSIYSLLAEHQHRIADIVEILAYKAQLKRIWQKLGEEEATQLLKELSWKEGYVSPETVRLNKTRGVDEQLIVPEAIVQRWNSILRTYPKESYHCKLAAFLVAREVAPLYLSHDPAQALAAISSQLISHSYHSSQTDSSGSNTVIEGKNIVLQVDNSQNRPLVNHSGSNDQVNGRFEKEGGFKHFTDVPPDTKPKSQVQANSSTPIPETVYPFEQLVINEKREKQVYQQFRTNQGGTLYLLNFLNRQPILSIMQEHIEQLGSGWLWLYKIAQLLNIDQEDPIVQFLANMALIEIGELLKLPDLPEHGKIVHLANEWYNKAGVWNNSLLNIQGEIRYSASHIDFYCTLSQVRLDVRMTGLDSNPGWLPWLGRVVEFHYD